MGQNISKSEQSLITQILVDKNLAKALDLGIKRKFFNGNNKVAFDFITNYSQMYGTMPSVETFIDKNPDIALRKNSVGEYGTDDPLEYWCDTVIAKERHNIMADTAEQIAEALQDKSPKGAEKAFQIMAKAQYTLETDTVVADRITLKDTKSRKEDYFTRKHSGGMTGLPSGMPCVDNVTGGLNNGELFTLIGYTGTGKSWYLTIIAVHLAKLGHKVLFFTTEMSTKQVFRRIDAMWNGFNYSKFKLGQLDAKDEKKYMDYLDKQEKNENEHSNLIVEQATGGITQISAKIDQYKPDIVLIDGAYLLEDEIGGDDDWKAMVRIWRGLHKLCLRKNIPMVVTSQSKDEKGAKLSSFNFAKAIAHDCDVVVVIERDEEMRRDREIDQKFLKLREGEDLLSIRMNWDFSKMDYSAIYEEKHKKEEAKEINNVMTL